MIALLREMKGVTKLMAAPKQGGESVPITVEKPFGQPPVQPKVVIQSEPKGNEASGSDAKANGLSTDDSDEH